MTGVAFLDLQATHAKLASELQEAVARVVASGRYVLGPELESFEWDWASFCSTRHAIGVGSGLDALTLAIQAAGIGPGDEVIVPAHTFIATWLAVSRAGATVVGADVDPKSMNVDPAAVEAAISERTAAIVAVHLYGAPADIESLRGVADRYGLLLVEDAAQAHGARVDGDPVGGLADIAAFSFYPGKNLGAMGDGGAVTTDDDDLAGAVRIMRNYGLRRRYEHERIGTNSRLDEIQAAILRTKLPMLPTWTARRRELASLYAAGLQSGDVRLPCEQAGAEPVWHLYVVRARDRDGLQAALGAAGVETLIHYPVPPHRSGAYADDKHGPFPVADDLAATVLSLPIGPHLENDDARMVIEATEGWRSPA